MNIYLRLIKKLWNFTSGELESLLSDKLRDHKDNATMKKFFEKVDDNILMEIEAKFQDTYLEDIMKDYIMKDVSIINPHFKFVSEDEKDEFIDSFIKTYPSIKTLTKSEKNVIFECLSNYLELIEKSIREQLSVEGKILMAQIKRMEKNIDTEVNKNGEKILKSIDNLNDSLSMQIKDYLDSNKNRENEIINDRLIEADQLVEMNEFEEALKKYNSILDKISRFSDPMIYCHVKRSIGTLYAKSAVKKDKFNNCQKAMNAFKAALEADMKDDCFISIINNDMGNVYCMLNDIKNDEKYLMKAINCYEESLKYIDSEKYSEDYLQTLINLGGAYRSLGFLKDKLENSMKAVQIFKTHEYIFNKKNKLYASYHNNLGIAIKELYKVSKKEIYLYEAKEAFDKALEVYKIDEYPDEYAVVYNNLSSYFLELANLENKKEWIEQSIKCTQESLKIRRKEDYPQDYAHSNWVIGNAYNRLFQFEKEKEILMKAIGSFDKAMDIWSIVSYPNEYANLKKSYGDAYLLLAEIENQTTNLDKAIEYYEESLKFNNKEKNRENYGIINYYLQEAKKHQESCFRNNS